MPMRGKSRTKERRVLRDCEGSRIEDQLWTQAYERLFPWPRRSARRSRGRTRPEAEPAAQAKGA